MNPVFSALPQTHQGRSIFFKAIQPAHSFCLFKFLIAPFICQLWKSLITSPSIPFIYSLLLLQPSHLSVESSESSGSLDTEFSCAITRYKVRPLGGNHSCFFDCKNSDGLGFYFCFCLMNEVPSFDWKCRGWPTCKFVSVFKTTDIKSFRTDADDLAISKSEVFLVHMPWIGVWILGVETSY